MTTEKPPTNESQSTMADGPASRAQRDQSLTLDERFEILKNERRRFVLEYLSSAEQPVELSELADHLAAIENDSTVEAITSSERKRVYVALYQFHLPKMDRMDVIDYDKDRGKVALTEKGRSLYQEHESDHVQTGYLDVLGIGVAVLGVVVLVGVVLTQSWFIGSVMLGIETAVICAKAIAEYRL